ncbi:vacuolar amino acid permease [Laetiporus sulphureus 93-53]|uniref:Vacuolar amino acid permease n=1 Tax=Laetiporus sulphureus 93-53 TaxID=1314785 RepID=A0A165H301_9APHY|nr:vacuolar amino acid permease [Laetiporus sulphureus 93-53]KZT11174.1 vacuolar amino acid permease [Laetiporus sulphureus 93-53]
MKAKSKVSVLTRSASAVEREPLLEAASAQPSALAGAVLSPLDTKDFSRVGPLDISRSTRYGILAGIWAGTFLSSLNTTLVATLLPSISSEFNKSHQAHWLGTAYLLATSTFTPLYGRLCNVMGRRGANQVAVFFAALGTAACGLSGSMEVLIAARFLGGLGGGGINTTATIITSDMYSLRSRGLTQGVSAVFNSLGMGLGGPLGGFISDRFGWRWAFLMQLPLFLISFILTSVNLNYVTPGKGKSTREVLKRIDYGGSFTLMGAVLSVLVFLSTRFSEEHPWSFPSVYVPVISAVVFSIAFVVFEICIAPEPVLAPYLLRQKIPVLVGTSNFLVATCNFTVMYNFPTWFQTVLLTSASEAGAHLIPNGVSISMGSLFAGWVMHRTGKYKLLNLIFGLFPFTAAILLSLMREDSPPAQLWLSIIPLGFGNAVVLQTMLIALLAHLPESSMAVGTGFGQLFRGIGQVSGVAVSAALFHSVLNAELHKRIQGPDAEEMINKIRHSTTLVARLPPDLQRIARDSYAMGLRAVFLMAACSTFLAYIARLPIPDKALERSTRRPQDDIDANGSSTEEGAEDIEEIVDAYKDDDENDDDDTYPPVSTQGPVSRRLSMYESFDGGMDLESDVISGSARRR